MKFELTGIQMYSMSSLNNETIVWAGDQGLNLAFAGFQMLPLKHAVQAFFDCLRAEVQEYGISVSTVNHTIISPPSGEKTKKSIWSSNLLSQLMILKLCVVLVWLL